MTLQDNISQLEGARDKIAKVYEAEATDDLPDNGNLSTMNEAILLINNAVGRLKKRLT